MVIKGKHRIIKPGQTFWARPEDIPVAFADSIRPLNPAEEEALAEEKLESLVEAEYKLIHRGAGKYNVIDAEEKVVNENPLTKDEAEELLSSLT